MTRAKQARSCVSSVAHGGQGISPLHLDCMQAHIGAQSHSWVPLVVVSAAPAAGAWFESNRQPVPDAKTSAPAVAAMPAPSAGRRSRSVEAML